MIYTGHMLCIRRPYFHTLLNIEGVEKLNAMLINVLCIQCLRKKSAAKVLLCFQFYLLSCNDRYVNTI